MAFTCIRSLQRRSFRNAGETGGVAGNCGNSFRSIGAAARSGASFLQVRAGAAARRNSRAAAFALGNECCLGQKHTGHWLRQRQEVG